MKKLLLCIAIVGGCAPIYTCELPDKLHPAVPDKSETWYVYDKTDIADGSPINPDDFLADQNVHSSKYGSSLDKILTQKSNVHTLKKNKAAMRNSLHIIGFSAPLEIEVMNRQTCCTKLDERRELVQRNILNNGKQKATKAVNLFLMNEMLTPCFDQGPEIKKHSRYFKPVLEDVESLSTLDDYETACAAVDQKRDDVLHNLALQAYAPQIIKSLLERTRITPVEASN